MTSPQPEYLLLGEVLRPHGIKGELRMKMLTEYPERIIKLERVFLGREPNNPTAGTAEVESLRMNQGYGLIKFKGVDDRDKAERYRELYVMVHIDEAVPLEEGEYYLFQIIGVTVKLTNGEVLGTITDILETGANDVYVVDSPTYGEVLIPVTDQTIISSDIDAREVIVELLDGMLPPDKTK